MPDKAFNFILIVAVAIAAVIGQLNILGFGQQAPLVFETLPALTPAEQAAHPTALELATWENSHNFGFLHMIVALGICLAVAIIVTAAQASYHRWRHCRTVTLRA